MRLDPTIERLAGRIAARLVPSGFGASARAALAHAGGTPEELEASIRNVAALVRAVAQETGRH